MVGTWSTVEKRAKRMMVDCRKMSKKNTNTRYYSRDFCINSINAYLKLARLTIDSLKLCYFHVHDLNSLCKDI